MIYIEDYSPHDVSEVICIKCGHRWIAVRPSETMLKDLLCPNCNNVGFTIETGQRFGSTTLPCLNCKHYVNQKCRLRLYDAGNCGYYEKKKG